MRDFLTTFCFLLTIVTIGQPKKKKLTTRDTVLVEYHDNSGLPVFNPIPVLEISKEAYGWTKSIDDKWLVASNKLPLYRMSTDRKMANSKEAELGQDNYQFMAFYEMSIDSNNYLVFVKEYTTGCYEFPLIQSGWETQNTLYYCIVARPENTDSIRNLEIDTNFNYGFRILDEKLIHDVSRKAYKDPWKYISERMFIERSDRKLVLQMERKDQGQLRFLIYSIHPVFQDPQSMTVDWKELNRSIFADKETLHRLHYTILESEWSPTILP